MTEQTARSRVRTRPLGPRWGVAVSGFLLMLGIGAMYGLSALQVELPRVLGVRDAWTVAPFAAASIGLAVGTGIGGHLLHRLGARSAGAAATVLWGASLLAASGTIAAGSFPVVILFFCVGGVGVGVAYLTIVATVGPSFPTRPLIGSAIGPLGFAAGTASFLLVAGLANFSAMSRGTLATYVGVIGAGIVVIALVGCWSLPTVRSPRPTPRSTDPQVRRAGFTLAILLFINALPGMLMFSAAVQIAVAPPLNRPIGGAELTIAALTITLFLGGLLAPWLRGLLGARITFLLLLALRGVLLLTLPLLGAWPAFAVLTAVVFFGHGAGFSLLPPLMRATDDPARFADNYGRALIAWGVAGAVGAAIAGLSVVTSGGFGAGLVITGVVAACGAVWLAIPRADHGVLRGS